jgi:hypothetical protein
MMLLGTSSASQHIARLAAALVLLAVARGAAAQNRPAASEKAAASSTQPALTTGQEAVRDRVQQLESRLLMLGRLLAENEPEKAERLRAALDVSGRRQVKRRLERVVELLRAGQLSDAEREQQALLADLGSMLTALTDTASDLDRKRAERERLEGFRRTINQLHENQLEQLYRTQQAAGDPRPAERLREIERLQRALEQRAAELAEQMKPASGATPTTPGERQVEGARQRMQGAADRLAEQEPNDAQGEEQAALEQLQRALNELDDSLRQVRREELEETLSTLETRFKSMLTRERKVRTDVLQTKGAAQWARAEQLRLAEAVKTQQDVAADCAATVRILVGEGTTVILPDLAEQLVGDMGDIAARLEQGDTSTPTQALLDQVIALLEDIANVVELRRAAEQEKMAQPDQGGGASDGSQPLLPGSAELKLLRSSQMRINRQTAELSEAADSLPPAQRQQMLQRLGERQRRIAELTRRMNERQ